MSGFLRRLFGGGSGNDAPERDEPVLYNGYSIVPTPVRDGQQWRVTGEISREVDGELRTCTFIRADTCAERSAAVQTTLAKARLIIDQQGDRMFEE